MSLEFNADKQELRSSSLKISSSDDLTFRSGFGSDEKEILRVLIDPVSKLPRIGVNRTGRRIQSIIILTAGSGYTTTPNIIISPPDDPINGIPATATLITLGESVIAASINNVGFGYNSPPSILITGGGGQGATAKALLDTVDYELDVNGAIRTSTSIISDTARILNLDIDNFITADINFRAPDLKLYANNAGSIWEANTTYPKNSILYFGDNLYRVENDGITGATAPLFKDGEEVNGGVTLKHVGYRVNDSSERFYEQTIYPRSVTPPLGDRSDKIATTEYVLDLATNDVGGRVYVSQEIGNNANNGRSAATPVRTIKRACQIASSTIGVKETVIISGGDYVEDNPISIPPDCSVVGDNLRLVIVRPANPRKHMFKFADKNYITGIVFRDQLDSDGKAIATWDFAVTFDDKQRLYYDPSVGGDFQRNFPIGHQIFGKLKFRVTFQDHTGIDSVGGTPVGSFFSIGETVSGVNTGATGIVTAISYNKTSGNDAYESGTFDVEVTGGSFAIGETFEYEVGVSPSVITYSMISSDIRSIRSEGEVVYHGTEAAAPLPIVRVDGSLQGTFTDGFGPNDDGGGIVFYTNLLIGSQNIHDFKEGQEIVISGLTGNLSVLNGIQRIYKVIEDADGRARRFVIPKKLPTFTDDNFIPPSANVVSYSNYVLISLLNSPSKFDRTADIGRRWQDATNLIKNNIEFIKDETYLQVTDEFDGVNYTTFVQPNPTKCRRDIGHFVNSICNDLQFGSNFNVIEAAKRYVQGTQIGYIGNEITETVRAFEIAKDLCKLAVRNWHTGTGAYSEPQYISQYSSLTYYTDATVIEDITPPTCDDVVSAVDTLGYLFVTIITNNAADRYLDAAELIARNEELILEETIGAVSTQYPDFYIPDDNVDTDGFRFKDGRNLIYANQDEIVDRALVEIGVQYPDFFFPGDPSSEATYRFSDAYRLIQQNKDIIAETALASIETNHPTFTYPGADAAEQTANKVKCRRDIGHFIDAVSLDIALASGNKYTRQFVLQYFDGGSPISNGLVGEEAQSNTAFSIAAEVMNAALTNTLSGSSSFTNATYATTSQTAVLSSPFNGVWLSGDVVSSKSPITDLTITADVATGSNTDPASCANVQSAIDNLTTIVTDAITAGNIISMPAETTATYLTSESKCRRDIGYIVKAVANDLYNGGNSNIILATKYYFDANGNPINNGLVGEEAQSVVAFNEAAVQMKRAVTNQLYVKDLTLTADPATGDNTDPTSCANVRTAIDTLVGIITDAVTNGTLANLPATNLGDYVVGENVCKRDIGYILRSLRRDMVLGGNSGMVTSAEAYFTGGVLTGISQPELPVTRYAFEKVRDLCILAVRNWHTGTGAYSEPLYSPQYSIIPLYTDNSVTEDPTPPTCDDVVSAITSSFTTLDGILSGGTSPTKTYGTLYDTSSIINIPNNTIYDANNNYANIMSVYDDLPIIEASPYIQNASVISFRGGGGAEIDGSKVKQPNCPFPGLEPDGGASFPNQGKSMVAAQFTIITFNGVGYLIKNDGYTQLVSVFVLFAKDGVLAETGGYASITNSATNFGINALRAIGFRSQPYEFDIGTIVSTNVTPNGSTILRIGGLGREPLEHYIVKFADYENQDPDIEYFVDAVSNVSVGPPFTASCSINAPILIKRNSDGTNVETVDDTEMVGKQVRLHRPSIVNSSSHTWEYAGSGTDYNALPENGGTKVDALEQVSENYGRVYVSGTDELGDFKVGTFAKIENRTGNITFTGTVSISEVEFLKLKGGDVVVTGFSAANNLGGAFASDSLISTQKAVRDYIGNNLGPYLNKPYSTNAVPRALVELTDSGKISLDQIPALRPFSVFTVADLSARLALEGPLAGDIAIQTDTNTSYILNNDLTSLYLGIPVDGSYSFTNDSLIAGSLTTGTIQVTEYRQGIVYEIQITDSGSGYTSVPTVTIGSPPTGVAATAVATIANGEVVTVTITFNNGYIGGYGYTSAPTVSFSAPGAGGTTASANALIESRVYGDIVNRIKISDTDNILDHAGTPNSINVIRVVNTSASVENNWVSLSSSSISAEDITSGTISTTRLALPTSGEANSFTFLAGDQTYKPVTQTIKTQERRYFLKTISNANAPTSTLIFAPDSRLLIGHEVFGSGINENTTITQLIVPQEGGSISVTLSSPITQTITSGSVITFIRPAAVVLFESSFVKTNYIDTIVIQNGGSGYTNGVYFGVPLTGGTGTGLTANIVVSSGEVTNVTVAEGGVNYSEDFIVDDDPVVLGPGVSLVLEAKVAQSVKNAGVIGMDIKRVDDKTLDADPYGNTGVARFLKSDTPLGRIGQFRFTAGGGIYIDQGPDSGFDADKLDGQQGNYYLNGVNFIDASISPAKLGSGLYNIDVSGRSGDTLRLVTLTGNPTNSGLPNVANVGIISDWKSNTADGLVDYFRPDDPDSGYHGVLTFRQFGTSSDSTGGGVRQLGFTDKNNLWIRGSGADVTAWSDWRVIWSSGNDGAGSGLDADKLDSRQGSFYQNARNINIGTLGAYHLPPLLSTTEVLDTLSVKRYPGNSFFNVYISGRALTTFPYQIGQTVNLYDSNVQSVGTVFITNVIPYGADPDQTEHYTLIEVRLDNGGFTNALRIGTANINEIFHDYSPSPQTTQELASISTSGGVGKLRLGSKSTSSTPVIDFNSSGNNIDYDVRLESSGGSASLGKGSLNIIVNDPNSLSVNNNIVWNAGNITFSTGISGSNYDTGANSKAVLRDSSGNFAANNIIASLTGAASLNVLKSGDVMTGNLTVGSVSTAGTRFVRVLTNDANNAGFEAYGNSQGTGYLYLGQSSTYGGGLSYNGDGSPAFATGEVSDNIAFYRTDNGTKTVVFQYPYNSNTVTFRGAISTGEAIFNGGTNSNTNDATVYITATNNNDWGLIVDKYNGSANEYGIQVDVGSSATYALRVRGNDAETFRVGGNGNIVGTGLALGTTGDITSVRTITLSGNISLTANSTRIQQTSTSSWSGDAGSGFGKLEYHSNRWYINAGSNSTEVARFRRGGTDLVVIDNSGNTSFGSSSTATVTAGLLRLNPGASGDGIQITGTNPTITFRDTNHRTGYIHVNSNLMYFFGGANNAAPGAWTQVANSRWPLYLNLTNNQAVFGGDIDANTGNIYARTFRTPAASFGSGSLGNNANNNNYVLYANGDRQWLDTYGVVKCNRQSIAENLTIPTTLNASSFGPITINNGITVYVGNGGTWTIS